MYSLQETEGKKVKEAYSGEDGRLSFLGRRLTFKVNIYFELHFQQLLTFSSKLKKRETNLSLVTQHPDSTQDIVEMTREDDEDDEEVWLTEEDLTNTDCVEKEWKKMGL